MSDKEKLTDEEKKRLADLTDPNKPGDAPETTGVIIHGTDPEEEPPPGDGEDEEGNG